jgi:hypothetical protein
VGTQVGGSADDEATTLGRCLDHLGPSVMRLLCAPRGIDVRLSSPVVGGPGEPLDEQPGALLLLVGGRSGDAATTGCLAEAGSRGFSGVVVRDVDHSATDLVSAAESAGVALLTVPADLPWREIDHLLSAYATAPVVEREYAAVGLGDLFALANAIASSVGGASTIEDPHGNILAYSNLPWQAIDERRKLGILGRQTPERPQNADEYRRILQANGRAVRFDFPDPEVESSRLAAGIYAGSEPIGVIFTLDGSPPLSEHAGQALEDAARIAALHLVRARTRQDPERWARSEALRSLLEGGASPDAVAGRVGGLAQVPTFVMAVAATGAGVAPEIANARIADVVSLHAASWHPDALCTSGGGVAYALLTAGSDESRLARQRGFASEIVDTLRRSAGIDVRVALGPVARQLTDVPESRRIADQILKVLVGPDQRDLKVAAMSDVRSQVVLGDLASHPGDLLASPDGVTGRILEHDARHGTDYAGSLLAFLDSFGETTAAAARLTIHENTLRYRLRRIGELFGLDLSDADDRLVTWLQLRLHTLAHASTEDPTVGSHKPDR